jgi:hypothetical protein
MPDAIGRMEFKCSHSWRNHEDTPRLISSVSRCDETEDAVAHAFCTGSQCPRSLWKNWRPVLRMSKDVVKGAAPLIALCNGFHFSIQPMNGTCSTECRFVMQLGACMSLSLITALTMSSMHTPYFPYSQNAVPKHVSAL